MTRTYAQWIALAISITAVFFLLAPHLVASGQARTPVLRPPHPSPVNPCGALLFRRDVPTYRVARFPWVRRSWCMTVDVRTAA